MGRVVKDKALKKGDKLSTKTRLQDVDKIYKALVIRLAEYLWCKESWICKIFHYNQLYIALNSMKHLKVLNAYLE